MGSEAGPSVPSLVVRDGAVAVRLREDGIRREHALRPSGRFAKPRPTRPLCFVPDDETSHALGDPFTALFTSVVAAGGLLLLGGIALCRMPGLLIGALG
ncbi:hypothetical protein [Streptomyces sp. NPDC058872]|uniref:hypothetical protein n=1 Tax=Streptomyces sp. NPDC058872 TaxID=3346661 RepID=UPI0036B79482